jgi:hypothetical protein
MVDATLAACHKYLDFQEGAREVRGTFEQILSHQVLWLRIMTCVSRNYWFENLVMPSRKLCLDADDFDDFKRHLEQDKDAGVKETVEATLAAIHVCLNLQEDPFCSLLSFLRMGTTGLAAIGYWSRAPS